MSIAVFNDQCPTPPLECLWARSTVFGRCSFCICWHSPLCWWQCPNWPNEAPGISLFGKHLADEKWRSYRSCPHTKNGEQLPNPIIFQNKKNRLKKSDGRRPIPKFTVSSRWQCWRPPFPHPHRIARHFPRCPRQSAAVGRGVSSDLQGHWSC